MTLREAAFYEKLDNGAVRCVLCPHNCVIKSDSHGICGVRTNKSGVLTTGIYGRLTAIAMDPIEKKPLYHFHPGSRILSIGTKGCNMKCPYCQNWNISQNTSAHTTCHSPEDIVELAVNEGSIGIAYTYSEPSIWYEYVYDTAVLAGKKGLANVLVTNGFINPEPLDRLLDHVDALNIDLKTFREDTYRKVQKARLGPVLETIINAHRRGSHVEITTLIVTGMNDDIDEMRDIMGFISGLDRKIPWHISRYYPNYEYVAPETDIGFMVQVREEAEKRLDFVYCGNVPSAAEGQHTRCPSCGATVLARSGYLTRIQGLDGGRCSSCGFDIGVIR
ncbi:MAG: AmmeMemoRadiSam system radical SAM enzyme [Chrysiogenales bacterium]|nr:MAG: AmmeMemoRadiSam system radical SAM enzyme [Chrysiogenales bacterium]